MRVGNWIALTIKVLAFASLASCAAPAKLSMVSSLDLYANAPEGLRLDSDTGLNGANYLSIESRFGSASLRILNDEGRKVEIKHSGKGFAAILQNNRRTVKASFIYPNEDFLVKNSPFEIPPNEEGSIESIKKYDHFIIGVPLEDGLVSLTGDYILFEDGVPNVSNYLATTINDRSAPKESEIGEHLEYFVNLSRSIEGAIQDRLFKGQFFLILGRFLKDSQMNSLAHHDPLMDRASKQVKFKNSVSTPLISNKSVPCKLTTWNFNSKHLKANVEKQLTYVTKNLDSGASIELLSDEGERNRLVYQQFGLANVLVIRPKVGLIFPAEEDFSQKQDYSAIEQRTRTMIKPELLPGDFIIIMMPLDIKVPLELSPQELVRYFTKTEFDQDFQSIFDGIYYGFKASKDLYFCLSKLEAKKPMSLYQSFCNLWDFSI